MIDDLRKQVSDLDAEIADTIERIVGLKYKLSVQGLEKQGTDFEKIKLAVNKSAVIQVDIEVNERMLGGLKFKRERLQERIGELETEEFIKQWNEIRVKEFGYVVEYNAMVDKAVELLKEILSLHGSPPESIRDRVIKSVIGSVWNIPKLDLSAIKIRQNYPDEEYTKIIEGIGNAQ